MSEQKLVVYISGPMSSRPDMNRAEFIKAQELLEKLNFVVVNPLFINPKEDQGKRIICLKRDIKALIDCDFIYMLDGWEKSRGATLEKMVADGLEIKRLDKITAT